MFRVKLSKRIGGFLVYGGLSMMTASAATYYIDSDGGNDSNAGTSQTGAWKTLSKASSKAFNPGDKVLLQRGDTFLGTLKLKNVDGTAASPIVIDAYGSGNRPIINSAGYLAGVHIDGSDYIEAKNLEIKSDGLAPVDGSSEYYRYGVRVYGGVVGTKLTNLYVHHIYPYKGTDDEGTNSTTYIGTGISIYSTPGNPSKDSVVQSCQIQKLGRTGIDLMNADTVDVLNNVITAIGGPGIVPGYCDDLIVRGNTVDSPGSYIDERMHGRGSGIWPYYSNRVLIEKNTFMHARGKYDSCGAHIDIGNTNVVVQYNLSIDNEGGFAQILGENENCAYRYNISVNDGARVDGVDGAEGHGYAIIVSGNIVSSTRVGPYNTYIYNNTIYVKSDQHSAFSIEETVEGVLVANNIFYLQGSIINGTSIWWDNYPAGMSDSIIWENNLYQKADLLPQDWPFPDTAPIIGYPFFANVGGDKAEDYIPSAEALIKDRGITITKIPGDTVGLDLGLAVGNDYFGNAIVGQPDLGAIELGY